jgi:hypothetical protein
MRSYYASPCILALILAFGTVPGLRADDRVDFFEKKIRPVLVEHCLRCHAGEKAKGGVRLDIPPTRRQGKAEPLVIPGEPDKSRLIRAVRQVGDIRMPPKGKLPISAIDALAAWVRMGATYPAAVSKPRADPRTHWAFRSVRRVPPPAVQDPSSNDAVDRFVIAALEAKGLRLSPPADKSTLLRRVTFDLIGLPPTPQEIDAFLADDSPDAYVRVVNRLLASPHYGERWGRHWLDVARYADTKGYVDEGDRRYPFAYTYRDWVIEAFNRDLPYDQFLLRQIAADHLLGADAADNRDLAALGLLTVGRAFEDREPDVIDDRLDVLSRGALGLTLTCARCHDHKFDPIPTADYYSLYGVFAGAKAAEKPLWADAAGQRAYGVYARELRARQRIFSAYVEEQWKKLFGPVRLETEKYLLAANLKDNPDKRSDGLSTLIVGRWKDFLGGIEDGNHPVFGPWLAYAKVEAKQFAQSTGPLAQKYAANDDPDRQLNARVAALFDGPAPPSLAEVAARYGRLLNEVETKWRKILETADREDKDTPAGLEDAALEELRQALYGDGAPPNVGTDDIRERLEGDAAEKFDGLRDRLNELRNGPAAHPHAMALADPDEPQSPRIFKRGNPDDPGDEVPRQFLEVLSGPARKPFAQGTGRLELAQAVVSKDNPLTARVWVNRVWMHLIGAGLVRTPSDFGARGEPPSHPELLDFLAAEFMADGWSTKRLQRRIVLSRTYRLTSADWHQGGRIDPENRLLWRMNRKRLEWEPLRDALLAVSGRLEQTGGGRSVDLAADPRNGRRTVYGYVDRFQLPDAWRAFDFPNPDLHSPRRHQTNVPQQALFLLNSPFAAEQARGLAARVDGDCTKDEAGWVREAYCLALGRPATDAEVARGLAFFDAVRRQTMTAPTPAPPPWQYGYGEFDEKAGRVRNFRPLTHFTGEAWQGGKDDPDGKLSYLQLTAEGGHPGANAARGAVRRWVAPRSGVVSVRGTLVHEPGEGETDGVRGRIVSGRSGLLGTWVVCKGRAPTPVDRIAVRQGDTLDFVVDCRSGPDNDTFTWMVAVQLDEPGGREHAWRSAEEFEGPPPEPSPLLSAREKFAQVLLLSNEFAFID